MKLEVQCSLCRRMVVSWYGPDDKPVCRTCHNSDEGQFYDQWSNDQWAKMNSDVGGDSGGTDEPR